MHQVPTRTIRQPSRRRIEYIPYAREVDTAGGRDIDLLLHESTRVQNPLKDLSEWGTVDIEALTMSLRSRISSELSYALTTFTVLTIMRFKENGFPIVQAPDLFDELVDLVEDVAFGGIEDGVPKSTSQPDTPVTTHRQLVNHLLDEGNNPFASLTPKQGLKDPSLGPGQRPGNILLAATNIIRNLSLANENHDHMGKHERLLGILLRLSALKPSSDPAHPSPLSPVLSTNDLVPIRKDVLHVVVNIGGSIRLSSSNSRDARRLFELVVSYIIDPTEALPPVQAVLAHGIPNHPQAPKPPSSADLALDAFTRISHLDDNRQVLYTAIPEPWLWTMFEALVHRLPIDNPDFQLLNRPEWLAYIERVLMSIYSIAFLASPGLKQRVKADGHLAFTKIVLRLIKKLTIYTSNEARMHFAVSVRRAIEALKLIDDAGDSFDVAPSTMPTLAFGMGHGEHGETRVEKGNGLLSGHQDEITWGVMMQREMDDLMFSELASLVRVQTS